MELGIIKKVYSEQLIKWRNSESIYKWCRQVDLLTEVNHDKWMESHQTDKTVKMYSIIEDDFIVGVCGLTDIDLINQRAEFSLYIGPEHQKKGYAKKALNLLLEHAFKCYPLQTIWGETFVGNPAFSLFIKMGFKHEGTRRNFYFKDGRHIDANLVSITRGEFYDSRYSDNNHVDPNLGIPIIYVKRETAARAYNQKTLKSETLG